LLIAFFAVTVKSSAARDGASFPWVWIVGSFNRAIVPTMVASPLIFEGIHRQRTHRADPKMPSGTINVIDLVWVDIRATL